MYLPIPFCNGTVCLTRSAAENLDGSRVNGLAPGGCEQRADSLMTCEKTAELSVVGLILIH
jgi:hypothetical protein